MNAFQRSKERQRAAKRVADLEAEVAALEVRLKAIEKGLSAPGSVDEALSLGREHGDVQDRLAARLEAWEKATLEAEALGV